WEGEGGHPAGMDSQADVVEEHVVLKEALTHGSVVIAAITSCTNTSNPSVLVTEYLTRSGLMPYLEKLKFNLVGYGCTTCIGNSGPLPQEVSSVIADK